MKAYNEKQGSNEPKKEKQELKGILEEINSNEETKEIKTIGIKKK